MGLLCLLGLSLFLLPLAAAAAAAAAVAACEFLSSLFVLQLRVRRSLLPYCCLSSSSSSSRN